MNLKYFKRKSVCIVLIFVFLLQSCTVYKSAAVSIEEAAATNNKVLIIDNNDAKLKYKKIEQIDGIYYGITVKNENTVKAPLTESEIKKIRVLDKTASTWGTIGIVTGTLLAIGIIIVAISLQDLGDLGMTY
jgi:hypothetical protein